MGGHELTVIQRKFLERLDAVLPSITEQAPLPPPVIAAPAANVEARLATLERLRSTGAMSAEEYAARRNKILDEI